MKKPVEFYFHSGENLKKIQLLLESGEVASLLNPEMSRTGVVGVGKTFVKTGNLSEDIHTLIASRVGVLWIGAGAAFYQATSSGTSVATVLAGMSGSRVSCIEQNSWAYLTDGTIKKKFLISAPTVTSNWGIDNPTVAPTVSPSGGNVACYYSWVAKYADGSEYETDLSPSANSTQEDGSILWTVPVSTNAEVTHRRLYRTFLGATYFVAEIANANLGTTGIVVSGSVTQANMRISSEDDNSFIDFSSAGTLTPYLGDYIVIKDSSGLAIAGWIGSAGTGESSGAWGNFLPWPWFESKNETYWLAMNGLWDAVAGGVVGGCCELTAVLAAYQSIYTTTPIKAGAGWLLKASVSVKQGTATASAMSIDLMKGTYWSTIFGQKNGTASGSWVEHVLYATVPPLESSVYMALVKQSSAIGTILFDNAYLARIIIPSATGVTVWSAKDSSDDAFYFKNPDFNYNDPSGYTYTILSSSGTTYMDLMNDEELVASQVFTRGGYASPPSNIWMQLEHYQRIFALVTGDKSNCFFCSEPLEPQAFMKDPDTGLYQYESPVFTKGDDIMGMAVLGADLFFASRSGFMRLTGSSPSYWSLRTTMANVGNIAKYAMKAVPQGIVHIWWDGIYLFNGYTTQKITSKCDEFFRNVNWAYAHTIDSVFDGYQYRLFVPYGTSTIPNRTFVIDFSEGTLRFWEETDAIQCVAFDPRTNVSWFSVGEEFGQRTGIAAKPFEVTTRMIPTEGLISLCGPSELHYEIDTSDEDVVLTLYYDNLAHPTTITLNTSSRQRGYVTIPFVDSRTFHFKLSGNLTNAVKIYEPWIVK